MAQKRWLLSWCRGSAHRAPCWCLLTIASRSWKDCALQNLSVLAPIQGEAKRKNHLKGDMRHHDGLRPSNLRGFATWQVFASKNIARHPRYARILFAARCRWFEGTPPAGACLQRLRLCGKIRHRTSYATLLFGSFRSSHLCRGKQIRSPEAFASGLLIWAHRAKMQLSVCAKRNIPPTISNSYAL